MTHYKLQLNKAADLTAPLDAAWSRQLVRAVASGVAVGSPLNLYIDEEPVAFQYTGHADASGSEIVFLLGFDKGQHRSLRLESTARDADDFQNESLAVAGPTAIGLDALSWIIPEPTVTENGDVTGPIAGFAGHPMQSIIHSEKAFASLRVQRAAQGPIFDAYGLDYTFADDTSYRLDLRFFKHEPMVEVDETLGLGMDGALVWTINPDGDFDSILSRDSFEGDNQPTVEPIDQERPRDVLCRLQMPVLSEYFVANNRGWFAFFDSRDESKGMLGVMGLYGPRWERPVANMPELLASRGRVEWHTSLEGGKRYWLLYAGPVQKQFTAEHRLIFHRLHAEFNACRLDEHLDLDGATAFDESCWQRRGVLASTRQGIRSALDGRIEGLTPLKRAVDAMASGDLPIVSCPEANFAALIEPTADRRRVVYEMIVERLARWVRQFQGYRIEQSDYGKNVIGFARMLRGLLIGYELLRKDGYLTEDQIKLLGSYFVFAARRILDEGRWPHRQLFLHPDHPESVRDFYRYGGETRPDRLIWTNALPNFQSEGTTALAHVAAVFHDHPDADRWIQYACDDFEAQLEAFTGDSGAYVESINYARYTFSYMTITFLILKHRLGIDYFEHPRFRRYAAWLTRFFGLKDKRFDAWSWPPIGNAVLPQNEADVLLIFAGELDEDDPLRDQCLAVYQACEPHLTLREHYPAVLAATAIVPKRRYDLASLSSENMDEIGVAMRHASRTEHESYLFQKIGFAMSHYENDETSFNWYAKGVPFLMDYGSYESLVSGGHAHNLVEIPEEDSIRRGFLRHYWFTDVVDYTHAEVPITLKLLWGRVRSFDETDAEARGYDRHATPYHYIGDDNPVGPKTWKVRQLLFVKPDYLAIFDRVYADVPHRYNLHFTGEPITFDGGVLRSRGRFGLDFEGFVQHPRDPRIEAGELMPTNNHPDYPDSAYRQRQSYLRLTNPHDGIYRTLLFAKEPNRDVKIERLGSYGMVVKTPEYTDMVFLHNDIVDDRGDGFAFSGRTGWVRRCADGRIQAMMIDGDRIEAFGKRFIGRGPWTYGLNGADEPVLLGGARRPVRVE